MPDLIAVTYPTEQRAREVNLTLEEPQQIACPWCGCGDASIEAFCGLQLLLCEACDQLLPLEIEHAGGATDDDVDLLEDTEEYDIVPCGPETFRVERRRS